MQIILKGTHGHYGNMLIVFIKYPEPGKSKTRLIPAIGATKAAEIQHGMSLRTLATASEFSRTTRTDVEIRFIGATAEAMAMLYGSDFRYREQAGSDLGQRLMRAIVDGFRAGAPRVIVIGTDCPAITADHLCAAQDALAEADVVLGPAFDGGYYLIGLRQPRCELFEGIAWSTEQVLEQTLDGARRAGLSVRLLERLADIDRPEDLKLLPLC